MDIFEFYGVDLYKTYLITKQSKNITYFNYVGKTFEVKLDSRLIPYLECGEEELIIEMLDEFTYEEIRKRS